MLDERDYIIVDKIEDAQARRLKWDTRFMDMAKMVSTWSKDPRLKVGAVITTPNDRIVSVGYNGFPQHIIDSQERLDDREMKLKMTIHAEKNAILFAQRNLRDHVIYTYPIMPCAGCASFIVQSGIRTIIYPEGGDDREHWNDDFDLTRMIVTDFPSMRMRSIEYE